MKGCEKPIMFRYAIKVISGKHKNCIGYAFHPTPTEHYWRVQLDVEEVPIVFRKNELEFL